MGFKCPEKPCNIYSFSSPPSFFFFIFPHTQPFLCQHANFSQSLPTPPLVSVNSVSFLFPTLPRLLNRLILLNPSSSSPRAILVHLSYSSPTLFPAFTSYFCLVYLWFSLFGNNLKLARTVEEITCPQTLESKLST